MLIEFREVAGHHDREAVFTPGLLIETRDASPSTFAAWGCGAARICSAIARSPNRVALRHIM